jgi:hypothetical protein
MISVEQLIGELLLRHNCVIVPTFGGFVASQTSAVIDYASGTMYPPKKSLMFNRQLVNNDGLLVSEYARINALLYSESLGHVTGLAGTWMEALRKGERVVLDKIGHLYFDSEGNIRFEQDRFFNLLLQSYGLGKVHFVAEQEVALGDDKIDAPIRAIDFTHVDKVASEQDDTKVVAHPAIRRKTKVWRYVAAACILPIAFYTYWIPVKTDVLESGMISIKDFNPFYHSSDGVYETKELKLEQLPDHGTTLEESVQQLPADVDVYSFQFDEDTYMPVKVRTQPENTPSPEGEKSSTGTFTAGMHYIVGCFGSETNAVNLVNKLRANGLDAQIVGMANGLSRVSAGSAFSEEAMQQLVARTKSLGFEGWVLKQ